MPKITTAVRDYRVAMMRELMDRCRLDALVFTTPDFFQFATISSSTCGPGNGPSSP